MASSNEVDWQQVYEEEYPENSAKRWATNISLTLGSPTGRRRFKAFLHHINLPEGFQQVELWEACKQACQTMTSETMRSKKLEVQRQAEMENNNISAENLNRLISSGGDTTTAVEDVKGAIEEVKSETEDNLGNKFTEFQKDILKRI